jgi:uncharacterized protein YjbJ (UPF0337 family)
VAGKVQEVAGKAVGSGMQQAKGIAKKMAGTAQAAYGDLKEQAKDNSKDAQHKHG